MASFGTKCLASNRPPENNIDHLEHCGDYDGDHDHVDDDHDHVDDEHDHVDDEHDHVDDEHDHRTVAAWT